MDIQQLQSLFGYMALINFGLLLFSFILIKLSGNRVYKLHSKIFNTPEESIAKALYLLFAGYKIIIIVFNVVPWLALKIVS